MNLITVAYTYPNEEGKQTAMLFDETLVRKACKINGCDDDLTEDCIEGMREGLNMICSSCLFTLIFDLDVEPEYEKINHVEI